MNKKEEGQQQLAVKIQEMQSAMQKAAVEAAKAAAQQAAQRQIGKAKGYIGVYNLVV